MSLTLPGESWYRILFRDVLIAPGKSSVNPTDTVLSLASEQLSCLVQILHSVACLRGKS